MSNNEKYLKELFKIDDWKVIQKRFFTKLSDYEFSNSVMSLANEYIGFRGYFEEDVSNSDRNLFMAGVWYPNPITNFEFQKNKHDYSGVGISAIDYLSMSITINNTTLNLFRQHPEQFTRTLNMKEGILYRNFIVTVDKKKIDVNCERFVSIVNPEWVLIRYQLTALNDNTEISWSSFLKVNKQVNNIGQTIVQALQNDEHSLWVKTRKNSFGIEQFMVYTSMTNIFDRNVSINKKISKDQIEHNATFKLNKNQTITLYKYVFIQTSIHYSEAELLANSNDKIKKLTQISYQKHKKAHISSWFKRWEWHDITIGNASEIQQGIRFNLFHLFSSYYGQNPIFNIPNNGFTSKKYYKGFSCENEIVCLPIYLLTFDSLVVKNLLMHRYYQLPEAKQNAQKLGLSGALYPKLTFNGLECDNTQMSSEQIHRNINIVYGIYYYFLYTNDEQYLKDYGLEIIIAICRFYSNRIEYNDTLKKYVIYGVTGPNEYCTNIDNNWYTNYGVQWVFQYCLELLEKYSFNKFEVTNKEKQNWKDIIKLIYLPNDAKSNIFIDHDNFLNKNIKLATSLKSNIQPIYQNWTWDRILRSNYFNQADVLKGLYIFNNDFSKEIKKVNFNFYESITVHENSLSPIIHGVLAANLELYNQAYDFFTKSCSLDLNNYIDNSGLPITAMAGSWIILVYGFAGLSIKEGLKLKPYLPDQWEYYEFKIIFHQRKLKIRVEKEQIVLTLLSGLPLKLLVYNQEHLLKTALNIKSKQEKSD